MNKNHKTMKGNNIFRRARRVVSALIGGFLVLLWIALMLWVIFVFIYASLLTWHWLF